MSREIAAAASLITLALIAYSIGVWSERLAGRLKPWHLVFFWAGLIFDTAGTAVMMEIAEETGFNIHTVSGIAAILLMLVHAAWATVVLLRRDARAIVNLHKFSVVVWTVWLIPYFTGFFASMR